MKLRIIRDITKYGNMWWATATYKGHKITAWATDRRTASWYAVRDCYSAAIVRTEVWGKN